MFCVKNKNETNFSQGASGQLGSELKVLSESYSNMNGLQIEHSFP
jgi:hypothetical protein